MVQKERNTKKMQGFMKKVHGGWTGRPKVFKVRLCKISQNLGFIYLAPEDFRVCTLCFGQQSLESCAR